MRKLFLLILVLVLGTGVSASAAQEDCISILLLGTDSFVESVTGREDVSRSDVILVLSVNRLSGAIKLLNIERDYLVELPGGLGRNKLLTATFFGGPQMGVAAVNNLFDLKIEHYIQLDIDSAMKILDLFGGIRVEVFEDELSVLIYPWPDLSPMFSSPGTYTLSGFDALAFIRSRDMQLKDYESNKGRNERQMRVMMACLDLFNRMGTREKLDFIVKALPHLHSNLPLSGVLPLARAALGGKLADFEYGRTPQGSFRIKSVNMHRVLVVDDMPAEIRSVHAFLYD